MVRQELQPILSPPQPQSELEFRLDLYHQLKNVMDGLIQAGLLDVIRMENGSYTRGFINRDGRLYPFPQYDRLQKAVKDNQGYLSLKERQGFDTLVVIPQWPIGEKDSGQYSFEHRINHLIRSYHQCHRIYGTKTKTPRSHDYVLLEVNTEVPLFIWPDILDAEQSDKLIYHGQSTREEHMQFLERTPFPGYEVLLIPKDIYLPKQGEGKTIAGRKPLENNRTASQYLEELKQPAYKGEIGYTLPTFLTRFALHLIAPRRVIYNGNHVDAHCVIYDLEDFNAVWLIGNTMASGRVLYGIWSRSYGRLRVYGGAPAGCSGRWGCPSAVRVCEKIDVG